MPFAVVPYSGKFGPAFAIFTGMKNYMLLLLVLTASLSYAQNNFQAQLTKLIEGYPSNFEQLKGDKEVSQKDTSRVSWKSKLSIDSAAETYIAKIYPKDKFPSLMVRYENTEVKSQAEAQYKAMVQKLKSFKIKGIALVSTEGKDAYKTYTNFTFPAGKEPKGYQNFVLQVKFTDHVFSGDFHFYSIGLAIFRKQ